MESLNIQFISNKIQSLGTPQGFENFLTSSIDFIFILIASGIIVLIIFWLVTSLSKQMGLIGFVTASFILHLVLLGHINIFQIIFKERNPEFPTTDDAIISAYSSLKKGSRPISQTKYKTLAYQQYNNPGIVILNDYQPGNSEAHNPTSQFQAESYNLSTTIDKKDNQVIKPKKKKKRKHKHKTKPSIASKKKQILQDQSEKEKANDADQNLEQTKKIALNQKQNPEEEKHTKEAIEKHFKRYSYGEKVQKDSGAENRTSIALGTVSYFDSNKAEKTSQNPLTKQIKVFDSIPEEKKEKSQPKADKKNKENPPNDSSKIVKDSTKKTSEPTLDENNKNTHNTIKAKEASTKNDHLDKNKVIALANPLPLKFNSNRKIENTFHPELEEKAIINPFTIQENKENDSKQKPHKKEPSNTNKKKAIKKPKINPIKKRKKKKGDEFQSTGSNWLDLKKSGRLVKYNPNVKPKDVYLEDKEGWKPFSIRSSIGGGMAKSKLSIKGLDEFNHISFLQATVNAVGNSWWKYAPTEQIGQRLMKAGKPIVVAFNLTKNGKLKNFRFIKKNHSKSQNQAVNKAIKRTRFKKMPKGFLYRNLKAVFIITPPVNINGNGYYIIGVVSLRGEVKKVKVR